MKRLMLILPSTTYRTHDFMAAATKLNLDLVVASDHRQAMASLIPDTTLALNFRKPEEVVHRVQEFHQKKPLDVVIGVDDTSVYLAGLVSEKLGKPHNPIPALEAARNKFLMREKLQKARLLSPGFQRYSISQRVSKIAKKTNYPSVVKPTFLSASRGVIRVNNAKEMENALEFLKELLSSPEVSSRAYGKEAREVLVEDYIPGLEVALEGILVKGELKTLAIFDKPDPLEGPYFIETIYTTPSRLPGYVQREVIHTAWRAARALGLEQGPVHAEMRINEDGCWVVEIAARSIGGLCSRILRFTQNITLEEVILRAAIGENIQDIQRESSAAGVMMIPVEEEGILKQVKNVERANAIDGIEDVIITIPNGQELTPMPQGGKYLGFIFARKKTPEEVEQALRKAYQQLEIAIEHRVKF
ncbi:MAG: ATP-grasp domain-containing protein [Calditrichaeota bacterium]|nr:MAG: ATP-grasp domain-containing protein [Calditrichota bacterium]